MTRFRKVISLLNELKRKRLINNYAIGGGVAAYRYVGMPTKDLDIFIIAKSTGSIIHLSPIYEYLKERGYSKWTGQFLLIEGYPVDFIIAKEMEEEAVINALRITYEGIRTRVMRPEYLIAISLSVGRPKDRARVIRILSEAKLNYKLLTDILTRYDLLRKIDEVKR